MEQTIRKFVSESVKVCSGQLIIILLDVRKSRPKIGYLMSAMTKFQTKLLLKDRLEISIEHSPTTGSISPAAVLSETGEG